MTGLKGVENGKKKRRRKAFDASIVSTLKREFSLSDYKIGDHIMVKLSGGRLVDAEIKAVIDTTDGVRLQVSFGEETALIYLWQVVEKLR